LKLKLDIELEDLTFRLAKLLPLIPPFLDRSAFDFFLRTIDAEKQMLNVSENSGITTLINILK
jgi:hypothetical protein